jgi:NAD(P)-dependent dehydrogenase (short-subunit alcohol dehydrogenase family)
VIAADVRDKAAVETAAIIRSEGGAGHSVTVDASDSASVESMVGRMLADHGRIDVLHNNVGVVGKPAYATAKAAINHLTAVTAVRYGRDGVRVNAVAPGLIDTPLIHQEMSSEYSSVAEMVAARDAMSPTGRMGTPWDVASAALFLASDDAAYINGVTLPVDGGLTVRCV